MPELSKISGKKAIQVFEKLGFSASYSRSVIIFQHKKTKLKKTILSAQKQMGK